ncbi:PLAC8-domain-containing protein [Sporormia fimetaria CBS 119925]|uniref:PLAC8-domain-containing protein n=1 Tax=Sporormia fimetaria CBS 119925 TaxID=1340428 RepID=A0A6A6V1S7_9PLEO|nr:PLAC8-domain-containing protein [Sporormia fimetaria CBS 119925]
MDPRLSSYGQGQHLRVDTVRQEQTHQRFSWQNIPDEEAPPYEPTQQYQQRTRARSNDNTRAFSYAQTPIEYRNPHLDSTTCPPLPTSPSTTPGYPQPIQTTDMKQGVSVNTSAARNQAQAQPFSPDCILPTRSSNHARNMSNLSPLETNLPQHPPPPVPKIPQVQPLQADSLPQKTPISATAKNRLSTAPYTPHGFATTTTNNANPNATIPFSPPAPHNPTPLSFPLHQPGQIPHPNATPSDPTFSSSLCSCSNDLSTCVTGLFCPCILYGRTSYRLSRKSDKKDPTDMLGYKATNGSCMLMSISCGLWWLFPALQRTRVRHAYKIAGSLSRDIVVGCCCCCCVAVQNEREVRTREESASRRMGPAGGMGYSAPEMMMYKPQR